MFRFLIIALCLFAVGCTAPHTERKSFSIPVIKTAYAHDGIRTLERDSCNPSWGVYAGKWKFADSIVLTDTTKQISDSDYLSAYIDTNLSSDGLQLAVNYNATLPGDSNYASYPVFVYNETFATKLLYCSYGIEAIQEAIDSSGDWHPVEYNQKMNLWICGTGAGSVVIRPGEFVVFSMPKYTGSYRTKMRVRLRAGNAIYVSPIFDGQINYSQFYLSKTSIVHAHLIHHTMTIAEWAFYGAWPRGYEVSK